MDKCKLCKLEKTYQYYKNKDWIICDCNICKIPMLIAKEHLTFEEIPDKELRYIIHKVMELFGTIRFRKGHKESEPHFSWHIITTESPGYYKD